MRLLITGSLVLILPGLWALRRAEKELLKDGRLTRPTVVAAFIAYAGHAGVTLVARWFSAWPLPIGRTAAWVTGGAVMIVGAALYLAGRLEFRSFRLTWGLETSRLVTTGIYRRSRNPQTLGALFFLFGSGVAGRSGVALMLVAVLLLASWVWLPIEESVLEQVHGEAYARYHERTSRYLGPPR